MSLAEITPTSLGIALVDLADCVCAQLALTGAGPTCWCGLYPGALASWEYCGECSGEVCGMGWVRFAGAFPYDVFPVPSIDERCAKPVAWMIEVGAMRCMPQPSDGSLPSPAEMSEVALGQMLDAQALYTAMKCCDTVEVAVAEYVPLGPEGGCVGGSWRGFVMVD